MSERDMYRYEMKRGKMVVCIAYAKDIREQGEEHIKQGHKFTHINVIRSRVSQKTAKQWVETRLKTYRRGHRGINPEYNRTDIFETEENERVPRFIIDGSLEERRHSTAMHELNGASGAFECLRDPETSEEEKKQQLEFLERKHRVARMSLDTKQIHEKPPAWIPIYYLCSYFEVCYIIENSGGNVHIIQHYERKRQDYHNQMLSYMGAERHSEKDEWLQEYIEKNYSDWKEKTLGAYKDLYDDLLEHIRKEFGGVV